MTSPSSRRRWWRRKRAWAAVLWLVAAYPVSLGPACYAVGRGWIGERAATFVYTPIFHDLTEGYGEWCYKLGQRHAAADCPALSNTSLIHGQPLPASISRSLAPPPSSATPKGLYHGGPTARPAEKLCP